MLYVDWCLLIVCRLRHCFTSFTPVFISSLPMFGSEHSEHTQWLRNEIRSWMEKSHQNQISQWNPHDEIVWLDKVNQWDASDCIPRFYVNLRRLNGYPGRASASSSRRDSAHSRGLNRVAGMISWSPRREMTWKPVDISRPFGFDVWSLS